MKRRTKIIIGAVLFLGVIGSVIAYKMWNQPHRDINDEAAAFETSVADLASEFQKDAAAATQKYHDKVVNFNGNVTVVTSGDSLTSLSLKGNDFCGVVCEMLPGTKDAVSKIKIGDQVTIKAFFMGFIEGDLDFGMPGDVMFKKGVIVQ